MGYEVMVIDESEERIQEHSSIATHAVQADSTDEQALKEIGIRNVDVVVVAIGADIQASILTTLILKEMGVKMIVAKARMNATDRCFTRSARIGLFSRRETWGFVLRTILFLPMCLILLN